MKVQAVLQKFKSKSRLFYKNFSERPDCSTKVLVKVRVFYKRFCESPDCFTKVLVKVRSVLQKIL